MPVIGLVALALLGAEPEPPTVPPPLERARVCWAAVDVECTAAALAEARAGLDALAPGEQIEVLALSAEVALSADDRAGAREHLRAVLERDPRFSPAWPEAWLAEVAEVRRAMPDVLPPELALTLPASTPPKRAVRVQVRATDPSGVARVTVRVAGRELACVTADGEAWLTEVPREIVKVPDLSLETVAVDRAGNAATRHDVLPVVVPPEPPSPPLTSRWWFWTALGVGVAAATTTIVLLATGGDEGGSGAELGGLVVDVVPTSEPSP